MFNPLLMLHPTLSMVTNMPVMLSSRAMMPASCRSKSITSRISLALLGRSSIPSFRRETTLEKYLKKADALFELEWP